MPSSSQLAAMADRAKAAPAPAPAPAPAKLASPERQPTQASAPILGPMTQPMPHNFAPAPALSPAQRAAQTRLANKAAGIAPGQGASKPAALALTPRPDGVTLALGIAPILDKGGKPIGMRASFIFHAAPGTLIPAGEAALAYLTATATAEGEDLTATADIRFRLADATADQLAAALPIMRRLTGALLTAYTESEDVSFPQLVLTLANATRADRLEIVQPDGSTATAKRGAAYISAFKAWEAHKAR